MAARKAEAEATPARKNTGDGTENTGGARETREIRGSQQDAVALLKADHRKVEKLFDQYASTSGDEQKAEIVRQICTELVVHTRLEEEIFYPACRKASEDTGPLDEAQVEHDGAKVLIADLSAQKPGSPFFDAKVKVLQEYIRHHVAEEEKADDGILARAASGGVDLQAIGRQMEQRRQALTAEASTGASAPPQTRSFDLRAIANQHSTQENQDMERRFDRDRDDRGRFTSDDDDRRYGGRSEGGRSFGGGRFGNQDDDDRGREFRGGRERDERGRFTSDDDDRGRNYGGSRERDDRGRFTGDDDRGRYSSRGGEGRGWFGDSQGHSEASRRGWDERGGGYRSRGREDDDDDRRYGSRAGGDGRGWFGDSQGHSEASRRGWEDRGDDYRSRGRDDDDDRRYGSRGGGEGRGWFGDPQGHAEASRRGWEDRGGRDGGGRERDERGRFTSDDDDRRGSGRGSGGWFGDSRGHAEAARRGWRNRD